jgi:hypothetical protein
MVREYNKKVNPSGIRCDSPYDVNAGASFSDTELFMSPKTHIKQKILKHPESRGAGFKDKGAFRGKKLS